MQVHFCPEGATVIIHDTPKTVGDHAESRRKGRLAPTALAPDRLWPAQRNADRPGQYDYYFLCSYFFQCFCRGVQAYNERGSVFRTSFFQAQSRGALRKILDVHI